MSRVKKLRSAVNASSHPDRMDIVLALDICLASPQYKQRKIAIDPLLAFGKKRQPVAQQAAENEFRLYARLTVVLLGYMLSNIEEAKRLRALFDGGKYADLDYAKSQYSKYKQVVQVVKGQSLIAIVDIDCFADKTRSSADNVNRRLVMASAMAQGVLTLCVARLEKFDALTQKNFVRWFGHLRLQPTVLNNYKKLLSRLQDRICPVQITYEPEQVWGKSSKNSATISIGSKFFNDESTLVSSDLALRYTATEPEIANAKRVTQQHKLLLDKSFVVEGVIASMKGSFGYVPNYKNMNEAIDSYATDAQLLRKDTSVAEIRREVWEQLASARIALEDTPKIASPKLDVLKNQLKTQMQAIAAEQGDLKLMEVTAYGVMIHELSHMVLGTNDTEAAVIDIPNLQCYGPLLCQILAREKPDLATNNADNYRQFAELFGSR